MKSEPSSAVVEEQVSIGLGRWAVGGTLSLPQGSGPFPAVVLVHGSGDGLRDGEVGPNRLFRELAWGLGRHGIAVLRYDKRTTVHAAQYRAERRRPTVDEEAVDDAVTAVQLLRSDPRIDPSQVYVYGVSMGASLAPKIANRAGGVAGIAMYAGSPRKPADIIADQADYVASLDPSDTAATAAARRMRAEADRMRPLPADDSVVVAGAPAGYWRWWEQYDAGREVRRFEGRVLLIRGERDYLVNATDWDGWMQALGTKPKVRFRTYPSLNHLMHPGVGKMTPAEYTEANAIPAYFIRDLAGWIQARE